MTEAINIYIYIYMLSSSGNEERKKKTSIVLWVGLHFAIDITEARRTCLALVAVKSMGLRLFSFPTVHGCKI